MNTEELFQIGMDRTIGHLLDMKDGIHLNIGAGNKKISDTIPLDYPDWDADIDPIPYADESISGIHAYHFLEHCAKPVKVLLEMQRVLKIGGVCNIVVPYYSSQMMCQDLDHKHSFCEETWHILFRNKYYDKNRIEWNFYVQYNVIIGIKERNLCLMTQLLKLPERI